MKRTVLFCAISALPYAAMADELPLATVIITAKGSETPGMAAVAAGTLRAQQAATSDTASLLRDVPGVSLYGAGGASSLPVIRGLADDRLRIKVDGMDLIASCPNHMNPALSYLDPSNVARLKVYAGMTPVSVGGDSIGGAIVADTPAPVFAAPGAATLVKGEVGGFYRSNGDATGSNLSATLASEALSVSYAGSTARSHNYRAGGAFRTQAATGRAGHTLALDDVGSSAYDTRNHTLGLAWRGAGQLLEAKFGYQDLPEQLYPNQRMDMLQNTQRRLNLRYMGEFGWGALEARLYQENVEHFMDFGPDKQLLYGGLPGMPMHTDGKTTGGRLGATIDLDGRDQARAGVEWQRYRLDDWWPAVPGSMGMGPNTFWNIHNGERERKAVYAEWEKQWQPQWTGLLGVRYEQVTTDAGPVHGYNQADFGAPLPAMDMMNQGRDAAAFNGAPRARTDHNWDLAALGHYRPGTGQEVELGLARKVRSPNLYERYSWSSAGMMAVMNNYVGDGNGYLGDVHLKPETAYTASVALGWSGAERSWEFRVAPYYTQVRDYIDAVPAGRYSVNRYNVLQYANQSARLYGVDVSGHMPLAATGAGKFGLKGLLSYTDGRNRDTDSGLYNIMPLNGKLTLTHQLQGWDNSAELVMVRAKHQVSAVRNELATPGYALLHLRASYGWQRASIDVGVENVFDRRYFLPLGGAYLGQGNTMSINPALMPWGTAVPGAGRSVYAGFKLKF